MFGQEACLGIRRINLPEEVAEKIYNEEQLQMALSVGTEDEENLNTKNVSENQV